MFKVWLSRHMHLSIEGSLMLQVELRNIQSQAWLAASPVVEAGEMHDINDVEIPSPSP
jgi:hypothetical protein